MRIILGIISALILYVFTVVPAHASTVISGTLSITNYAALTNATSGQSFTLNGDTRTFTNSLANTATQIKVRTNDSAATILLSIAAQVGSYPFANVPSITASNGTNITFRATNDTALTITLSPTNWGKVTYSTQTVGTVQTVIRVPMSAEESAARTNNATQLWQDLDAYSQARSLGRVEFSGRVEMDAGFGLHGRGLVNTNYTLTTNDLYLGVDTRSNTNLILTLPSAASASNLLFIVKDEGGAGATNTIKIFPQSGDRIDTLLTNVVVSNNFGGVQLRSRGGTNWAILAAGGGVTGGIASSGGVPLTNTVWVAKNGSDSGGARGDASKAFLTLGAAKTNALSGDTIFVMPGTYDEKNLLKNGVNWNFASGAKVTYTGGDNGSIFDDGSDGANTNITSAVTGFGEFYNHGSAQFQAVYLERNSIVRIQARSLKSDDYVVEVYPFDTNAPVVLVEDATIAGPSRNPVFANGGAAVMTFDRCRMEMQDTSNHGAALYLYSANTNSVLRDCVLIGNAAAGSPVSILGGLSGTKVRIYGSLMSNLTNDTTNVSILTGASRFEVSSDVQ